MLMWQIGLEGDAVTIIGARAFFVARAPGAGVEVVSATGSVSGARKRRSGRLSAIFASLALVGRVVGAESPVEEGTAESIRNPYIGMDLVLNSSNYTNASHEEIYY